MNNAVNNEVPGGTWSGTWVAERLGVELLGDDTLTDLLGLALRRNPKRAHLLVSNVLGKHVPQSPSVVYGHGLALGRRVRDLLGAEEAARAEKEGRPSARYRFALQPMWQRPVRGLGVVEPWLLTRRDTGGAGE